MFQVLALTGLYQAPKLDMTQADWRHVHCNGDSECHVMKTRALEPELQVIFFITHAAPVAQCSAWRELRRRGKRAPRRAGGDEADMTCVSVAGTTLACRAHGPAGQRKCPALSAHFGS